MQPEQHYRLTVRQGAAPGKVFDLARDVIVMGRDLKCDVVLNDPEVSRNHTRLTAQADGYVVEDLESTNGTFVNSQKVTAPRLLQPGDLVGLGENLLMEYTLGDSAAATIVMPSAQSQATSLVSPTPGADAAYAPQPAPMAAQPAPAYEPPPPSPAEWAPQVAASAVTPTVEKKSNRTTIIVVVVILLLLCCCCLAAVGIYYAYTAGMLKSVVPGTSALLQLLI